MLTVTFASLIEASVTTGAIVFVLTMLSPLLNKKYTAKWKYWVWLILAVRLTLPISLSLPQAPVQLNMPEVQITVPQPIHTERIQAAPAPQTESGGETGGYTLTSVQICVRIWLAGFLLFLLYQLVGYRSFRRRALRWSRPVRSERILGRLRRLSVEMGVKKQVAPLTSGKVSGPMMTGFIKPLLLLPHEDYTDTDLYFILKHELVHYKRRDIWYKLLLLFANAVHWFNPLVYLMLREANKDMELSCDDEVTKGVSFNDRMLYSETILSTINHQLSRQTVLSTYFYGGTKAMKERFSNILNTKKKRSGMLALLIALVSTAIFGGLVACKTESIVALGADVTDPAGVSDANPSGDAAGSAGDEAQEKIVIIDPGHGGGDAGAIHTEDGVKISEKEINLKISLLLQDMLKQSGVRAELTRQGDQAVSLENRMELAGSLNASLFVSVHLENSQDPAVKGSWTLYNASDAAAYGITGQKAAQLIHAAVEKELETEGGRVEAMPEGLKYSSLRMPAVRIAPVVMSNGSDRNRLMTEEFSLDTAKALHNGIMAVLNEL